VIDTVTQAAEEKLPNNHANRRNGYQLRCCLLFEPQVSNIGTQVKLHTAEGCIDWNQTNHGYPEHSR